MIKFFLNIKSSINIKQAIYEYKKDENDKDK